MVGGSGVLETGAVDCGSGVVVCVEMRCLWVFVSGLGGGSGGFAGLTRLLFRSFGHCG